MNLRQWTSQRPKLLGLIALGVGAGATLWLASRRKKDETDLDATGHSAPDPHDRKFGNGSRDVIEEGSWESFPASDPPAW